jgi:Outer membrane protein beta-barrel domain
MKNNIFTAIILLISLTTVSFAQKSNVYLGAEYNRNTINTGITNISSSLDEKDYGYSIFLGTEINKYLDVEIAYNDFGKASLSGVSGNQFKINGTTYQFNKSATFELSATSYALAFRPKIEVTKNLDLVGILGVHRWDSTFDASSGTTSGSVSASGTDPFYGIGAKVNFDNLSVGLNYTKYEFDSDRVKSLGLRASYKF